MAVEAVVAKIQDLKDGDMKEVKVGETTVLLSKIKGEFHAVGGICTHYGGNLAEGACKGDRVYCPWHMSAFNMVTGDLLEPPGLDAVPRFEVRLEGEDVIVRVPEGAGERRVPDMAQRNAAVDPRTFVILGAGAAGLAAAEALRQDGFQGRVVMITQEKRLPYDRPELSKNYLAGANPQEVLWLRSREFFETHDLEIFLETKVARVEAGAKTLSFADGTVMKYDALLVATGGLARPLEVPGGNLAGVFTLRNLEDAEAIIAAARKGANAVIAGASFIGMETAGSLSARGLKVTVAAPGPVPFHRTLGPEIGRMWQRLLEENGVSFRLGARVERLEGRHRVEAVLLDNGEQLPADLVIAGVGVKPATEMLQGVPVNPDGSVTVDEHLRAAEGLYAAGDIARFPDWRTGDLIRIEHWRLAMQHGRVAAHNMAGKKTPFRDIPFFWSERLDIHFQYAGYVSDWDEIIYHGDPATRNFLAFYVKNRRVLAAAGCQHLEEMAAIMELMRLDRLPAPEELRRGPVDFLARLREN
ncbi:MAG: NAD(FAD)-dependent dehydrogenase [Deltaproteobacteria bacterium]|nr:MAG: NAD(FAD)-dependent dehydrogenase [Deltaproteobacteria bacterium]